MKIKVQQICCTLIFCLHQKRMNVHHILLICFLSALFSLAQGRLNIYTGPEGGDGSISCHFSSGSSGSWRFFCKSKCSGEGILVQTEDNTTTNGRFSINYKSGSSGRMILSLTISNLTQSDSGRYKFGVGSSSGPDSYCEVEFRVSDDLLDRDAGFIRTYVEGEDSTFPCYYDVDKGGFFFCKGDCKKEEDILIETDQKKAQRGRFGIEYKEGSLFGLYVTITDMKKSDTGSYKCGYGRALTSGSSSKVPVIVIEDPSNIKSTQTLRTSPTLAPSLSPLATISVISFTSEGSTPQPTSPQPLISFTSEGSTQTELSTETTELPTTAAPSSYTPAPTSPQTVISSTGPLVFSTHQSKVPCTFPQPNHIVPLVVFVSSVGVLLLILLLLYLWKKVKKRHRNFEVPVLFNSPGLASTCELAD